MKSLKKQKFEELKHEDLVKVNGGYFPATKEVWERIEYYAKLLLA
ncbi:hypothetical protein [Flammeovirga kamogawensis]|nr:hypothetical protein [Flammeovirga kamogawensis]MBB6461375.1 hypothetical protein [Flammeovirga kamogawensis]